MPFVMEKLGGIKCLDPSESRSTNNPHNAETRGSGPGRASDDSDLNKLDPKKCTKSLSDTVRSEKLMDSCWWLICSNLLSLDKSDYLLA